jgi:hypothetical protein
MHIPCILRGPFCSRPYKVSLIHIPHLPYSTWVLLVKTLQGELDPHPPFSMRFLLVQTLQGELDLYPFYAGTSGRHPICKVNLIHIRHNLPRSFWSRPYNVRSAISTGAFWSTVNTIYTLYNVSLIHICRIYTLREFLLVQTLQGEIDPHSRYDVINQSLQSLIEGEYSDFCCFQAGAPKRLLKSQEQSLLKDIREAIDKRVENRIATAR